VNQRLFTAHDELRLNSGGRANSNQFQLYEEMEDVRKAEALERERPNRERPLVFLDTNVIIRYLQGEPSAVKLCSTESNG